MNRADPQVPINPWLIAIAVMISTFMEVLDTTVVNVSLPHIAGSLSASVDEATWVLTSYLVANAIVLPITGWLAGRFGRKNLLMASVIGFTSASFLCGLAPTLSLLICFRMLQGFCGGALQPLSQAILLEAFPPQDRGKAMGFWGLGIVVAPVLGPVLGGWLTDSYSWRWVFYINIPVGVAAILMTRAYVFDPAYLRKAAGKIDYWGIALLAVWIGALQIVLDKGQEADWFGSNWIVLLSAIGVVFLIFFLVREGWARDPVVNLRVFKYGTYAVGVFLMTIVGFVLYGSMVVLPIWLQTLLGYPAMQAGLALAPRGMGSMVSMPIVGALTSRIDPRKLLGTGLVLGAGTMFAFSHLNLNAGYWDLFWPQFVQGMSLALIFVPLTTITMSPVPKQDMGNATSIFNLMRNLGGSIGIAMVDTFYARFQQTHISNLVAHVIPGDGRSMRILDSFRALFLSHGSGPGLADQQSTAMLFGMVERQASMLSFIQVFHILTLMFLVLAPFVLLMRKPAQGAGGGAMAH